jgi:DNA-directed RNA polymerase subunit RPC12/RpoP
MSYKCGSCNRTFNEFQDDKHWRCPYCGSRIIFKTRPTGRVKVVRDVRIKVHPNLLL